jgi:hypothetical protein
LEAIVLRGSNSRACTPSLRRHKGSSLGVVTLDGKDHYFGHRPQGRKNPPPEVQTAYDRLIAEGLARGRCLYPTAAEQPQAFSVNQLLLAFIRHAEQHYRRENGAHTSELQDCKKPLRPVRELYGTLAVADFGPLKLKAVRQRMIDAGEGQVSSVRQSNGCRPEGTSPPEASG